MFNIFDKQRLCLTQGNSAEIGIVLTDTDTGDPITIDDGDKVLFTVKNQNGVTVIQKTLTPNDLGEDEYTIIVSLIPSETVLPTGEYEYDVLLCTVDGQAVTFISSSLVIKPAVGLYTDVGGGDNG